MARNTAKDILEGNFSNAFSNVGSNLSESGSAVMDNKAMVATALGDRFGTLKPFLTACIIYLASLPILAQSAVFAAFFSGACILLFSAGMGVSYAFANISALDNDGRYTILVVPAIGLGALIAPGIAGFLSSDGSYTSMLFFGATAVSVAIVFALIAGRSARAHHIDLQKLRYSATARPS